MSVESGRNRKNIDRDYPSTGTCGLQVFKLSRVLPHFSSLVALDNSQAAGLYFSGHPMLHVTPVHEWSKEYNLAVRHQVIRRQV